MSIEIFSAVNVNRIFELFISCTEILGTEKIPPKKKKNIRKYPEKYKSAQNTNDEGKPKHFFCWWVYIRKEQTNNRNKHKIQCECWKTRTSNNIFKWKITTIATISCVFEWKHRKYTSIWFRFVFGDWRRFLFVFGAVAKFHIHTEYRSFLCVGLIPSNIWRRGWYLIVVRSTRRRKSECICFYFVRIVQPTSENSKKEIKL